MTYRVLRGAMQRPSYPNSILYYPILGSWELSVNSCPWRRGSRHLGIVGYMLKRNKRGLFKRGPLPCFPRRKPESGGSTTGRAHTEVAWHRKRPIILGNPCCKGLRACGFTEFIHYTTHYTTMALSPPPIFYADGIQYVSVLQLLS